MIAVLHTKEGELETRLKVLRNFGGAVSVDLTQKLGVDYAVITAHLINEEW